MAKVIFAETHTPLFINGINLSTKLDPARRQGLAMEYDEDRRVMYVSINGHRATVFEANIAYIIEAPKAEQKVKQVK